MDSECAISLGESVAAFHRFRTQGGVSTSQAVKAAKTSTQADLPSTAQTQGTAIRSSLGFPSQGLLDGLSSPGFQQMISDILLDGDGGYKPDTQFDGSQVHLVLNEAVSDPTHAFIASRARCRGGSSNLTVQGPK
ncbi:hypothetical protein PIB30_040041 [Stylosanthes scabra]|uniref:Uncharacterized protein n=1 Tax=Stylosanthes scabra TaxID=79078 RepID=A0ABU6TF89_9FABA|nr:hypothetical protein [Stylosanthes scabra]